MAKDTCSEQNLSEFAIIGCKVLDDYLEAFNTGDVHRWAATLHYPHIRIAGDRVRVWETKEAFARDNDMARLVERINWGRPAKLHHPAQPTRHPAGDDFIPSFESLDIITPIGSRWGVQGRSSYGGVFAENTGY